MNIVELDEIHAYYGLSHVLQGVSLALRQGEIATLIGRNGAGKSTTLKSIMGLVEVRAGRIVYAGQPIMNESPHVVAQRGITLIPEDRRIFPHLTALDNLRLGLIRTARSERKALLDSVLEYFPLLRERLPQLGGSLSGGEQQMLALARGLLTRPRIMLVDEPSQGLMPRMVNTLMEVLQQINRSGITVLLVEQNIETALAISHRGYIIDQGRITFEGSAASLRENAEVQRKFLMV